jgi:hypothetical protein
MPFYARVLEEFTIQLHASGHQALIVHVDSGHSLDSVIPRLASYRVDAIVSALAVLSPDAAEALAKFKIPVVSVNTPVKNEWVSSVSQGGGRDRRLFRRAPRAQLRLRDRPGRQPASEERAGDVLMWDNRATMHRGRRPACEARVMVRTTVQAVEADGLSELRPAA